MRQTFLFLFFFLSALVAAQSDAEYTRLAERLADYGRWTMDWNPDALLDLTDPQLFEIVDRQVMAEQLRSLHSDDNIAVAFSDFTVDDIGAIVRDFEDAYAPVRIHHRITFRMLSADYRSPAFFTRMQRMLEKNYGKLTVDPGKFTIEVVVNKTMFAIRHGVTSKWYFVEYRPENAALMDLLVPHAIQEQFK